MTTLLLTIIIALLPIALWMSYRYGYAKGIRDLTKEIDEVIKKLKELRKMTERHAFSNQHHYQV